MAMYVDTSHLFNQCMNRDWIKNVVPEKHESCKGLILTKSLQLALYFCFPHISLFVFIVLIVFSSPQCRDVSQSIVLLSTLPSYSCKIRAESLHCTEEATAAYIYNTHYKATL